MDLAEKQSNHINRHPWELARMRVVKQLFARYAQAESDFTVLDIGCGDLFLAEGFVKDYPQLQYFAIDNALSNAQVQALNTQYQTQEVNIRVWNSLEGFRSSQEVMVDAVFLFDIIEHIENDVQWIRDLSELSQVNNRALWFVTVPAYQSLFSSHDLFLKHYRRYNHKQLRALVSNTSFEILAKGDFFSVLLCPRIFSLLIEKFGPKKNKQGVGSWRRGRFLTQGIARFLYAEFQVMNVLNRFGIKLPGLSKYIICQKSA